MARSEREAVGRLNQLTLLHRMKIYKIVSEKGLYMGQQPVLDYIKSNDMCTQKELASFLGVSPASVSVSVKRLEKAGCITRRPDESDARGNRLSVTEKGRQASRECRSGFDSVDAEMFAGFTSEEIEQLTLYLDRMIFNLSGKSFRHEDFCKLIAKEKELLEKKSKEE